MKKLLQLLALWVLMIGAALAQSVNINTATKEQLDGLKGIGPVKAQAIVDYRTKNGPFKTADDLQNVSGIGPATMKDLRASVTVGDGRTVAKGEPGATANAPAKKADAKDGKKADSKAAATADDSKNARKDVKKEAKDTKAVKDDKAEAKKDSAKAPAKTDVQAAAADAKSDKDAKAAKDDKADVKKDSAKADTKSDKSTKAAKKAAKAKADKDAKKDDSKKDVPAK